MSAYQLIFIVLTIIALSVGQILFKLASESFDFSVSGVINSLSNATLIIAFVVYFSATFMWLLVLKSTPLRMAYPFVALAFFIVPILSYFFLGERINWNTFAGAILIAIGVWISVYQ